MGFAGRRLHAALVLVAFDGTAVFRQIAGGAHHPAHGGDEIGAGRGPDRFGGLVGIDTADLILVEEILDRAFVLQQHEAAVVEREAVRDRARVAHRHPVGRIGPGVHLHARRDEAAVDRGPIGQKVVDLGLDGPDLRGRLTHALSSAAPA